MRHNCVYSYVFETPPPINKSKMQKYSNAPHPFIIEPPISKKEYFKKGEELKVRLILIGESIKYFPYFVFSFEEMGKRGIGREKGQLLLKYVKNISYDNKSEKVFDMNNRTLQSIQYINKLTDIAKGISKK